jgi:hypothetical protein
MPPVVVASRSLLIGRAPVWRFFSPRITQQMRSFLARGDLAAAVAALGGILAWAALFALLALD